MAFRERWKKHERQWVIKKSKNNCIAQFLCLFLDGVQPLAVESRVRSSAVKGFLIKF